MSLKMLIRPELGMVLLNLFSFWSCPFEIFSKCDLPEALTVPPLSRLSMNMSTAISFYGLVESLNNVLKLRYVSLFLSIESSIALVPNGHRSQGFREKECSGREFPEDKYLAYTTHKHSNCCKVTAKSNKSSFQSSPKVKQVNFPTFGKTPQS